MSLELYLAFVVACLALAVVPGPSSRFSSPMACPWHARRADQHRRVQLGLGLVMAIVAVGLTTMMATMATGSIGYATRVRPISSGSGSSFCASPRFSGRRATLRRARRVLFAGFLMLLTNPKVLVFFGAFIPSLSI